MDDFRFGTVLRLIRQRRGWRQQDLADKSGFSQSAISRMERGHLGTHSIVAVRAVAAVLDIRVDLVPRWRAGDLDRLLNSGHSMLHESVARMFRDELPAWVLAPEVSFAIYAERGVIDILAWHPGRRALLIIELKTDLADINELVGTFDRKRRLARQVAVARGLDPVSVSAWLIIASSRTNRRRVQTHDAMLRAALPNDGPTMKRWLRDPVGSVNGLSFWTNTHAETGRPQSRSIRRVRPTSHHDR
jgi:transcriptional regulator with XRE-family HTH domain